MTDSQTPSTFATARIPWAASVDCLPQLLVSVQNAEEARLALNHGVPWIDLKDPSSGALGAAQPMVARDVAQVLNNHPQRSAALGELVKLQVPTARELARYFPVVKVGLAHVQSRDEWRSELLQLHALVAAENSQLVPVLYADGTVADAATPAEVIAVARQLHSNFMLIDTFHKTGQTLLDALSLAELQSLVAECQEFACNVIVAGSLRTGDFAALCTLPIAAVGVRGAACEQDRRGAMSARLLADVQAQLASAVANRVVNR